MNEFFFNLTPDEVILAVEEGGFSPTGHCLALNSLENRVYDLKLEDESHVVAKFYRPGRWSEEAILEEHSFLRELSASEIPAVAPLPFPDGSTLHRRADIYFALWPRRGGRAPDEPGDEDVRVLGRLLARIHNLGASRKDTRRLTLDEETYALNPLRFLLEGKFLPPHLTDRYADAVEKTAEAYHRLSREVPFHRIHGDCHMGNILHGEEGWFVLDFDDFLTGPAVQDFWMLVPALDAAGVRQREIFLEAYGHFREFDPAWFRLIEPLRALRYIHYAAWIARRWEDPAFPSAFPHFGTDAYWEKETEDLEKEVAKFFRGGSIYAVPEELPPEEEESEEELTNKDFFWDWEDP